MVLMQGYLIELKEGKYISPRQSLGKIYRFKLPI